MHEATHCISLSLCSIGFPNAMPSSKPFVVNKTRKFAVFDVPGGEKCYENTMQGAKMHVHIHTASLLRPAAIVCFFPAKTARTDAARTGAKTQAGSLQYAHALLSTPAETALPARACLAGQCVTQFVRWAENHIMLQVLIF